MLPKPKKPGLSPQDYTAQALKSGDSVWPANNQITAATTRVTCLSGVLTCLVLPAKAMSICSSTCWGPKAVFRARIWGQRRGQTEEVEWQTAAIEGKLDLLVTLDFRLSSTCLFSDIVLPTATWYEKTI